MSGWYNPPVTLRWIVDDGQPGGHYDYTLRSSIINFSADWNVTATPLYNDLTSRLSYVAARAHLSVANEGYATPNTLFPYHSPPRAKLDATIGKSDITTLAAFKAWGDSLFTTVSTLATPVPGQT